MVQQHVGDSQVEHFVNRLFSETPVVLLDLLKQSRVVPTPFCVLP